MYVRPDLYRIEYLDRPRPASAFYFYTPWLFMISMGIGNGILTWNELMEELVNFQFNPLSVNPPKWSNTLKQFVGYYRRIVWVCLTFLWGWRLKGYVSTIVSSYHETVDLQWVFLWKCKKHLHSTKDAISLQTST